MKAFLPVLLLAFSSPIVMAQSPIGSANSQTLTAAVTSAVSTTPKGDANISGTIVDAANQQGVGFATITLNDPASGKAVDGTLADEKGKFTIPKVGAGTYQVVVTFIGYETRTIDNVKVGEKDKNVDLGELKINSSAIALKAVEIQTQRALVEEKVDRTVYNAENDASNRGGDASDVLRKVPMLSVDLDGNVSLRGNQNIKVLINNRPSTITAGSVGDALKQIPSDLIKSVEVITSPSAKYDAEGSAGIVNIILKKNNLQGGSLGIDTGIGLRGTNLGLNGSYRSGKMGFSLGGFGRTGYNTPGSFENTQITTNTTGDQLTTLQNADTRTKNLMGRYTLGWDYDINEKNYLNSSVMFGTFNGHSFQDDLLTQSFRNGAPLSTLNQEAENKNNSGQVDVNVNYTHLFAKPQQELSILTQFSRNNRTNDFLNHTLNPDAFTPARLKNLNESSNQESTVQIDYQNPIGKTQMVEVGVKGIMRRVSSDFQRFTAEATGDYVRSANAQLNNVFNYNQNVMGSYLSYTLTTPKQYSLKVGGRYEYTNIDADFKNNQETTKDIPSYGVLVPSINLSKKLKGGNTVKASYTRRIQRPSLQFLNPAIQIAGSSFGASGSTKNITQGNPNLDPEYTNNFELGYSAFIKRTSLNFSVFTRNTNNSIQSIRDVVGLDTVRTTYANIGQENAYGFSINGNVNVGKLMLMGGTDTYYSVIDNNVADPIYNANNKGWVYNLRAFGSYNLGQGWGLQGFGFYRGRQVQLQGYQGGFGIYSLNVKKDINDKKGSIGFGAENFFTTTIKVRSEQTSPIFSQKSTNVFHNLNLKVNFSYRIGKMSNDNAPRKNRKSVTNDDLKGGESGGGQDAGASTGGSAPAGGGAPGGGAPAGGRPGGMPAGGQRPAGVPAPTTGITPGQAPANAPAAVDSLATPGQPANINGTWQAKMGDFEMNLQLQAEGETLTGTMQTPRGVNPIANGKIIGNEVSFTLNIMGTDVPNKGKVEGDTLTLSSNFQGQERVITFTRVK
ncbi:TonB-dependent receptor [Adhaeribacter arboris]|uniref:TonB-dependent receptor n=1 Tax=Adhaeribacter arboris TaxID=2072846 RepID=A0A2T2YD38_9BACT|nr:TonB-dependent receptor [Adhaeribacter arboris]PSR53427.1 TonB-dependent receptor [Adhaeribacter arboris]